LLKGKMMDSHIQLPNGILKHFRSGAPEASGRVFYLDLNTSYIGLSGSGRLGTEAGYYSEEIETYLNEKIETPFTTLAAKVRAFIHENREALTLDSIDEEICKNYVAASMARSKPALDSLMTNSVTAQFMGEQANHDDLVFVSTQPGMLSSVLKAYKMLVIVNRTARHFVVPRNCFYEVQSKGSSCIVVPISPGCVLELVPPDYSGNIVNGEECRLGYIDDPDIVCEMNRRALRYEYAFNQTFVASASRFELEQLKAYLEANREHLNSLKTALE